MSLAEVQSRALQLQQRLQQLSGGTPPVVAAGVLGGGVVGGGVVGGVIGGGAAPVEGGGDFAATLAQSLQATGAAPSLAAGSARSASSASGSRAVGAQAVALASQHLGTPYVFGGSKPGGFDCSGLMQWTYRQLGVELPRVSSQQGRAGVAVEPADAQPGDLVYFDRTGPVDHIGMYAGNGTWVVAPHTGAQVRVEPVDLSRATSIRRVVGGATASGAALRATGSGPSPGSTAPAGWAAGLPAAARPYTALLDRAAANHGLDPRLLSAVAWTESGFNPGATSPVGARGLMQLMPRTAAGLGVSDATDPAQALDGGARYLSQQLAAFGGRTRPGPRCLQRRPHGGAQGRRRPAVRGDAGVRRPRARPVPAARRTPVTTPLVLAAPTSKPVAGARVDDDAADVPAPLPEVFATLLTSAASAVALAPEDEPAASPAASPDESPDDPTGLPDAAAAWLAATLLPQAALLPHPVPLPQHVSLPEPVAGAVSQAAPPTATAIRNGHRTRPPHLPTPGPPTPHQPTPHQPTPHLQTQGPQAQDPPPPTRTSWLRCAPERRPSSARWRRPTSPPPYALRCCRRRSRCGRTAAVPAWSSASTRLSSVRWSSA